ncbi:MAG: PQQ-binding-like beta-propeller repeat protein, partial [Thermomicrobiales bacterium]
MNRMVGAPLAILLALSGLLAPSPARATAQVDGNTYNSPDFGYSLTWNDRWFLLDGPNSEQGFEDFTLANGASVVYFFAEEDGIGNAQVVVSSILVSLTLDPTFSNVQPLTDEDGNGIRGGDASRAYGGVTFTDESEGQATEGVAYVEARALVPGQSTLSIIHFVPRQVYEQEAPLVQELLTGLTINDQASPDPPDETPTPEPEEPAEDETPTPEPESGSAEGRQAFVSANWRVTVVAAQRDDAIQDVSLEEREDKEWVVVVADVTNWSAEAVELTPRDIELRFPEGNANRVALRSTVSVANDLDIGPDDVEQPVAFQADETQRWALVYLIDADQAEAALALRLAMSIEPVVESNVDLLDLPPVTDPPELIEAGVDVVRDGETLDVTTEPDGAEVRVELLGADAPSGDDCFADESQAELESLAGDTVFLEYPDGGDASDGPAYVWAERDDGSRIQINRQMVAGGFAEHDPADNALFASWLGDAQASAEEREIGLWEACTGPEVEPTAEVEPTVTPTDEPTAEPTEEVTATPTEEPTAEATATPRGRPQPGEEDDPTPEAESAGVMFRGDAARTGAQPGPGLGEPATFPWEIRVGFPFISSPAVVDGVVYIGSLNSEVYALDAFSGPPRWTFLTEGQIISSPAVDNDLFYVGSDDGNLYEINSDTGT